MEAQWIFLSRTSVSLIRMSFTPSTLIPVSGWVGLRNYTSVMATRNWKIAFDNLLLFGSAFVLLSLLTGLVLVSSSTPSIVNVLDGNPTPSVRAELLLGVPKTLTSGSSGL